MSDFSLTQGNRPKVADTLKLDDVPVDLTGCTVVFKFQSAAGPVSVSGAATIVTPSAGTVEYIFGSGETDVPGLYTAQWVVTKTGITATFPTEPLTFDILPAVPEAAAGDSSLLVDQYELVRAILGDLNRSHRRYQDDSLAAVLRSVVRLGRVPGYALTPDLRAVTPALANARALGLLVYHAAKMFLMPNVAAYSYATRAMRETFGEQRHFLFELENALFDLTNGEGGVFVTYQSFYGWVDATTGTNLWLQMTELKTNAPVATATIGRDGLQISTT